MSSSSIRRTLLPCLGLLLSASASLQAAPPNRIRSIANESGSIVAEMVPGRTRAAHDLGQAALDRKLTEVTLRFSMTEAQQAALSQLLSDQQNPNSPRYHQWLTPQQFGAQFGLSSSDLAKVSAWLTSQGLIVTDTAASSTSISVSGTVAQMQKAFRTSIHRISSRGEQHVSNVTDPVLPSGVAAVVTSITGLNDFQLKSRAHPSRPQATVRPEFTSSISGNHYIAPADFYTIYDVNPLLSSSINGAGVTIAVMGQTDISLTDIAAFRSASGLSANLPTVKLYGTDPGTSSGDLAEAQLDVEWSGAVAPSAAILYVNSTDVLNRSLANAITNRVAPILSISYGACEVDFGAANLAGYNQLFQQANAQGQTIVGPSGDSGATDCDYNSTTAVGGLTVDFPASSPYVTGAGGTQFNEGTGSYWSASNGTNAGSALSYLPEIPWNESSSTYGLAAAGGGASAFFTKPTWQIGPGVPADSSRDVPDISLAAASSHDGFLYCLSGACVNGFRAADNTLSVVGGTSVSSPSFAGMLALVAQKTGSLSGLGNVNPTIYALANSTYYNNVFHDITSGNNSSTCLQGTPNCPNGGLIGYTAAPGYDLASGWGSIDAFNFATKWSLVTPIGTANGSTGGSFVSITTVTSTAAACGISSGSLLLSVKVANGNQIASAANSPTSVPTGTVQFMVDGTAVGAPVAISSGAATFSLNTAVLASGGHTVSAAYSGDAIYGGSKGTLLTDVVSTTSADFALTPCAASTTIRAGGTAPGLTFTVTPFNGFKGAVTFSASSDSTLAAGYTFSVSPVTISSTTGAGTVLTLYAYSSRASTANGLVRQAVLGRSELHRGTAGLRTFYETGSGIALASVLLFALPRRRRWAALVALALSVSLVSVSGCGSGGSSILTSGGGTGTSGTSVTTNSAPGTYTVNVTAIAGTLVHTVPVTFVVQ